MPELADEAAKVWKSVAAVLEATPGLLRKTDGPQLERYARFFVRWREIENEIDKRTIQAGGSIFAVLANEDLRPAMRGLQAESRRLDQAMKEIEGRYGMTPGDRRNLAVQEKPKQTQLCQKPA